MTARPTRAASYPVSVRQVMVLLHAAFRPHLATTPLRFANTSPPSGCVEDLHLQAAKHARHTTKSLRDRYWLANFVMLRARLHALGYQTIGDIADASPEKLQAALGSLGNHLYELANARDPRRIEGHRVARSMGSDRTLNKDVSAREDILLYLRRSADRIARRLRRKNYQAGGVRVRLKTTDFKLISRQCTLAEPTDVAETLFEAAQKLLDRFDHPGPFRLVGLAAHSLERPNETRQLGLLDEGPARALEVTLDRLAERYGDNVVRRARDITQTTVADTTPNLDFLRS